ncbi:MAG: BlaI/MecI/CopY family transcriptional regulator [Bacteroidota bacterium]
MSKLLTPLELKVMNILWEIESGFVKDILDHWEDPNDDNKPAYNTVSTIVRILKDKKGFVDIRAHGRTHEYFPIISQETYRKTFLKNAISSVFEGKVSSLVSTLVGQDEISQDELDELKSLIDEKDD